MWREGEGVDVFLLTPVALAFLAFCQSLLLDRMSDGAIVACIPIEQGILKVNDLTNEADA